MSPPDQAVSSPLDQPAPSTAAVPPTKRPGTLAWLLVGVVLLGSTAWLVHVLWRPGGPLAPPPPPLPFASLRVDGLGAAGGPWILEFTQGGIVVVGPDGARMAAAVARTALGPAQQRLVLTPPHPILGTDIVLTGTNPVSITAAGATAMAQPPP